MDEKIEVKPDTKKTNFFVLLIALLALFVSLLGFLYILLDDETVIAQITYIQKIGMCLGFLYGIEAGVITAIPFFILWVLKAPKELYPINPVYTVIMNASSALQSHGLVHFAIIPPLKWYKWYTTAHAEKLEVLLSVIYLSLAYCCRKMFFLQIITLLNMQRDSLKMWKVAFRWIRQDRQIQV